MQIKKIFVVTVVIALAYLTISSLCFAFNIKITDSNYKTHWSPNEDPSFMLAAQNNEIVLHNVYFSAVLTNLTTGATVYISSSASPAAGNGGMVTMTAVSHVLPPPSTRPPPGIYSVVLILYETAGIDTETDRRYGAEPVHVGDAQDSVAAFPKVLDLGALQYGRYMHPVPIEISWNFFNFSSQVRKDHQWYMRIYTDNHKRYKGIEKGIYTGRVQVAGRFGTDAFNSPAGLVSSDGRYTIPLKIWCSNFGPDVEEGWNTDLLGPPPVNEDQYWKGPLLDNGRRDGGRAGWLWIPDYADMTADSATWRNLIGQNSNDTHYARDANPTGDFTLPSPFRVFVGYETSPTCVAGKYSTDLIVEIYSP